MSEEEREARRLWYETLQAMLAAYSRAKLDGEHDRATELEAAQRNIKAVGSILGWRLEDARRHVLAARGVH
jgi:hypothetical protein